MPKKNRARKKGSAKAAAKGFLPALRGWVLPLVCYLAAIVLYVGGCCISLVSDHVRREAGALVRQELTLADFSEMGSVEVLAAEDGRERFVSTDGDPQLIYRRDDGFYATRFVFDAQPNHPGGEMVLYYTLAPDDDFSEKNKLWAQQDGDGRWYFDLPGQMVYALRLDPNTTDVGVLWEIDRMILNEPKPVIDYFIPDVQPLVLLAVLPGLAAAFLELCRRAWNHAWQLWLTRAPKKKKPAKTSRG